MKKLVFLLLCLVLFAGQSGTTVLATTEVQDVPERIPGELCNPIDYENNTNFLFCNELEGDAVYICVYQEAPEGMDFAFNTECRSLESEPSEDFKEICPQGQIPARNYWYIDMDLESLPLPERTFTPENVDKLKMTYSKYWKLTPWFCGDPIPEKLELLLTTTPVIGE